MESVILVNEQNTEIGTMEKMEAHVKGVLHRAISVFVFNTDQQLLLQQRAEGKYHSAGKWSNTCCSHPRPGESGLEAAQRRLTEEMGMECKLTYCCSLLYRAELDNGLTEYEYDQIYVGMSDQQPGINTDEVQNYQYIGLDELSRSMNEHPDRYTAWLSLCLEKVRTNLPELELS